MRLGVRVERHPVAADVHQEQRQAPRHAGGRASDTQPSKTAKGRAGLDKDYEYCDDEGKAQGRREGRGRRGIWRWWALRPLGGVGGGGEAGWGEEYTAGPLRHRRTTWRGCR